MRLFTLIQIKFVVAVASALYWFYNPLHHNYTFASTVTEVMAHRQTLANEQRIHENIFIERTNKDTLIGRHRND